MPLLFRTSTARACPQCGVMRLIKDFRRWRGSKRVLHDVCNTCEPDRKLSEMTPEQRLRAVEADRPRARLFVVEAMNDAEQVARRHATSRERLAYHAKERRRAWREAIGERLAREHDWAKASLRRARTLRAQGFAQGAAWEEFFLSYEQVLRLMRERIEVLSKKKYAPIKPTMEQCDPCHYADASTRASLRRMYSACRPIPGRRLYRDPWCLTWGQE